MAFADELREAGGSKNAILHEFLSQHNPNEERVHAFVEGYDDPLFYRAKLLTHAGKSPVYIYPCMGKPRLYEIFEQVNKIAVNYRHTLFFPDKDLEDIIPEPCKKDPRIFVTEFYSIENYLAYRSVVERACLNFVRIKNCVLPVAMDRIALRFEEELQKFHRLVTPIMAWIVCVRRGKQRPNLKNINLNYAFTLDDDLRVAREKDCIRYLCRATGVPPKPELWKDLRKTVRELKSLEPKTFIRGKFETWFLVEFLKKSMGQLRVAAEACGGTTEVVIPIERRNALTLLSSFAPLPASLDDFLTTNFAPHMADTAES